MRHRRRNAPSFYAAIFLLVPMLGGCELLRPAGTQGVSTSDVTVRIEESEQVELESLGASLVFVDKISESRCPRDVACVWAGEARIRVAFTPQTQKTVRFELLISGLTDARSEDGHQRVDTLGYRFSLLELAPYPDAGAPQPDAQPLATIRIEALDE